MKSSRKQRWQQLQSVFEPGFKQMLLASILIHLLVPILYYSPLFPQREIVKPPVYRVNLVNKIVKNPQAGRPEATVVKKKTKVKPKAKPKPKPKVKPKAKPIPAKPKAVKPKPKAVPVKPKPKPKPKPVVSQVQDKVRESALDKMRAKVAAQAHKDKIAALKAAALAESLIESPIVDAPVGMADGKGDEAGVSAIASVQEFIQQQWVFSEYQAAGKPEAEVKMAYNREGTLLHYKFIKKSGNSVFDESLTRAIVKSKHLPQALPEAMEFEIVFNLKDMLDK